MPADRIPSKSPCLVKSQALSGEPVEVSPRVGGNLRVRLGSHQSVLESQQSIPKGQTTLHIASTNGMQEPEVRGPAALRVLRQDTRPTDGMPGLPVFTLEQGKLSPVAGPRGADSTVVVDAGEDTVAVISGSVPVDGSVVVRLMPTGEGSGDELVYMAQRYVVLENKGSTPLADIHVDLMMPHQSVVDALSGDGQEAALMAMLGGGNQQATSPTTYVKYASLTEALTLQPGTHVLPLGEPTTMRLKADINAEVEKVKPSQKQHEPFTRAINTFANVAVRNAPEALPPASYEVLDRDGRVLSTSTQDAIAAKQGTKLGRIPFAAVTGECEVSVEASSRNKDRAVVTMTADMKNAEPADRQLDVMFDLWNVSGFEDLKVFVDGEPVEKPKVKLDPQRGLLFVPTSIPAANAQGGVAGQVTVKVVMKATLQTAAQRLAEEQGSAQREPPSSMYN